MNILGLVGHLVTFQKYIILYFNSYRNGCGVRSIIGYSRILIPDEEKDFLGHILFRNWEYDSVNSHHAMIN